MKNGKILNLTIIVFGLLLIHPLFVGAQDASTNLPRIMYWGGKVNQHWDLNSKSWKSDSDGTSGSGIDMLTYCKKYYPKTVSIEPYKEETTNTWQSRLDSVKFTSKRISYLCLETASNIKTPENLKGRILIQVESKGEAYYINPKDGLKYYMSNGDEAFKIMKTLGVGMSNKDIVKMKSDVNFRKKFIGKILLQVESHGEAYYISFDGRYNYLKDGASALTVMKKLGLGISNANLNKIAEYKAITKAPIPVVVKPTQTIITNPINSNATNTDMVISNSAVSKLDSAMCNDIKDHKLKGTCLITIQYKRGNKRPCEVLGNDYPELADDCKKADLNFDQEIATLAVSKLDSVKCLTIKDHKIKGECLAVIEFKKGSEHPCEVLGNNYPELADECKQLSAETNRTAMPLERDARTISDVKLTQVALELYYNAAGKYPTVANSGSPITYQGNNYIGAVPTALVGATSACLTNFQYKYTYINDSKYTLTYCIDGEGNAGKGFNVGINTASQSGIK